MASPKRQDSLDGLRGLAALAVFVHHVWSHQLGGAGRPAPTDFWGFAASQLHLGLILFFVLSGFLLYRGFVRHLREDTRPDLRAYLKRRAARILPAYYVAILGCIALFWGSHIPGMGMPPADQLPLFALFGQNYSHDTHLTLDSPTWTLCVEVAFYLLLPILVAFLLELRAGWRFQAAALAALVLVGIGWSLGVMLLGGDLLWQKMLPSWLPYFAFGMAAALWIEYSPRSGRARLAPALTAIAVLASLAIVLANALFQVRADGTDAAYLVSDMPAGIGFALLIAVALIGTGPGVLWLRARSLVRLGVVSYGFYLWHLPVLFFLRGLHPEGGFAVTFALGFPVALLLAVASWKLVEQPVLRRTAPAQAGNQALAAGYT